MLLLVFQTTAAWNMHHDFGASSERMETTVTLTLAEDGTIAATDIGSDRFHDLHRDGRTSQDAREWSSTWHGTWSRVDGALQIALAPTAESCTHNDEPCPAPGALALTCQQTSLPLEPAVVGWQCAVDKGTPHTLGSWLFVEGRCVEQTRGRFSGHQTRFCTAEATR